MSFDAGRGRSPVLTATENLVIFPSPESALTRRGINGYQEVYAHNTYDASTAYCFLDSARNSANSALEATKRIDRESHLVISNSQARQGSAAAQTLRH